MSKQNYFASIWHASQSLWDGLRLTLRHLLNSHKSHALRSIQDSDYFEHQEGIATIQYPHEALPIPDTGRYRLFNEIDDCIVCDKCAKICPVNCITIEPIRAVEEFGKTSDGTPKRIYAAKFDIDMGKCCFCGLCTTVCPTECLTMTKVFDFSVYDIREHNYEFAEMTAEEINDKKSLFEQYQKEKAQQPSTTAVNPKKPIMKPRIKPPGTA